MHGLVGLMDLGLAEDHRKELLREAEERRLARRVRGTRRTAERNVETAGGRDSAVTVRWGLHGDDEKIAGLLELNGLPRWVAFEERFVVAEREGVIVAALSYRTEPKRMLLGALISDPWAGERALAVALYTGVRHLAREMCVREIHAQAVGRTSYLREAGYHRRPTGWRLDEAESSLKDGGYSTRWRGKMFRLIARHVTRIRVFGG
jgi:hypothetical protein